MLFAKLKVDDWFHWPLDQYPTTHWRKTEPSTHNAIAPATNQTRMFDDAEEVALAGPPQEPPEE